MSVFVYGVMTDYTKKWVKQHQNFLEGLQNINI